MDHRELNILKVEDIEGTDNGVLYLQHHHGLKTGDLVNIEWRVDHVVFDDDLNQFKVYCWRRSPDTWTEEQLRYVITQLWKDRKQESISPRVL